MQTGLFPDVILKSSWKEVVGFTADHSWKVMCKHVRAATAATRKESQKPQTAANALAVRARVSYPGAKNIQVLAGMGQLLSKCSQLLYDYSLKNM
jgi:hypothetical protein